MLRRVTTFFLLFVVVLVSGWIAGIGVDRPAVYAQAEDAVQAGTESSPDDSSDPLEMGEEIEMNNEEGLVDQASELPHHLFLPWVQAETTAGDTGELVQASALSKIDASSAECLYTYQPSRSHHKPSWIFVLNFNVWQAGNHPVACVLLRRSNQVAAFTALRVPCKRVGAITPITIAPATTPSKAQFDGGYIQCPIDLIREVNRLGEIDSGGSKIVMPNEESYAEFIIIAAGLLRTSTVVSPTLYANPLVSYQPAKKKTPDLAFFAPFTTTNGLGTRATLASYYRNQNSYYRNGNFSRCLFDIAASPPAQTWYLTRGNGEIVRHGLQGIDCAFPNQPQLSILTNGTFFIGYSALLPKQRLQATVDEILVDPTGSTLPPT